MHYPNQMTSEQAKDRNLSTVPLMASYHRICLILLTKANQTQWGVSMITASSSFATMFNMIFSSEKSAEAENFFWDSLVLPIVSLYLCIILCIIILLTLHLIYLE